MKKYIIVASLCALASLNAAEQAAHPPREWMAKEYAKGNKFQVTCFLHWLQAYKIDEIAIKNKDVISFGCGTGEIEGWIVKEKQPRSVHGIDASLNQILYATKTQVNGTNKDILSFQHCFVEDFKSKRLHDLAIASCSIDWIENKPEAFKRICNSVKPGGLFFANMGTKSNSNNFGTAAFEDMKKDIPLFGGIISALSTPIVNSRPTDEELEKMLLDAGFDSVSQTQESYDWTMTEPEWRQCQLALLLGTSAIQTLINSMSDNAIGQAACWCGYRCASLTEQEQQQHDAPFFPESTNEFVEKIRNNNFCKYLFNKYLNLCLDRVKNNGDGTYTWKYETTVILAQKE